MTLTCNECIALKDNKCTLDREVVRNYEPKIKGYYVFTIIKRIYPAKKCNNPKSINELKGLLRNKQFKLGAK